MTKVITSYISLKGEKIIDRFSNQEKKETWHKLCAWSPETDWDTGAVLSVSAERAAMHSAENWVWLLHILPVLHGELSLSLPPPPLQRQHKAMKDWRQSDVLRFILPESLRMLSVPHEGSDESRLSVCHLIISQKKSLWCYPLTMAHSSLLTTVPTNNEELTAATNGDEVVPTVHLRVRRISNVSESLWVLLHCRFSPLKALKATRTFHIQNIKTWMFGRQNVKQTTEHITWSRGKPEIFWPFIFLHVDTNTIELTLLLNMQVTIRPQIHKTNTHTP